VIDTNHLQDQLSFSQISKTDAETGIERNSLSEDAMVSKQKNSIEPQRQLNQADRMRQITVRKGLLLMKEC
jgi:hypothetical protein